MRPPSRVDGRRPGPENPSEDTLELCTMEVDVNTAASFVSIGSGELLYVNVNIEAHFPRTTGVVLSIRIGPCAPAVDCRKRTTPVRKLELRYLP